MRAAVVRPAQTWAITVTGTGLPALALARMIAAVEPLQGRDGLTITSVTVADQAPAGPRVVRRPR